MPVESVEANHQESPASSLSTNPAEYRKPAYIFMTLLVLYVIVRGIRGASLRPFWFDELFTLTIAGQASLRVMWAAILRGFDTQGPVFYAIERLALSVPIKMR